MQAPRIFFSTRYSFVAVEQSSKASSMNWLPVDLVGEEVGTRICMGGNTDLHTLHLHRWSNWFASKGGVKQWWYWWWHCCCDQAVSSSRKPTLKICNSQSRPEMILIGLLGWSFVKISAANTTGELGRVGLVQTEVLSGKPVVERERDVMRSPTLPPPWYLLFTFDLLLWEHK